LYQNRVGAENARSQAGFSREEFRNLSRVYGVFDTAAVARRTA
jgi:hypothetical protein